MSTNLAYAPARPIRTDAPQPHIAPVARPVRRAKPRVTYVLVIVGSLFAIYMAQLLLSIALSQGAYQISSLQEQQTELLRTQEALRENLDKFESPQNLANNALSFGMIPSSNPAFLRLSDGSVSAAPDASATAACGATCDLVANALLVGVPLVSPAAPAPASGTTTKPPATTTPPANAQPTAPGELPSPVTH
ncbi:MAG: hypothetical protein ABJB03_06600 [Rhodoglobus sp.]